MEQFDFREFDVVLSVSTMVAKGLITASKTCHISMCCTPMRWAWDLYQNYLEELKGRRIMRFGFRLATHYYRWWDIATAARVNYFIAGSRVAAVRIRKHYGRGSEVIYPSVDTDFFVPNRKSPEDFYLVVSRLVLAKRIDLVVEAFSRSGRPLVVIGQGEQSAHLKRIAAPNIRFLGYQPDAVLQDYYARCRALIFPGEDDFGLTIVEAQASGRPVIGYAAGGVLETIQDGVTGIFFRRQTPECLNEAVERLEVTRFNYGIIRKSSLRFSTENFKKAILQFVETKYAEYMKTFFG